MFNTISSKILALVIGAIAVMAAGTAVISWRRVSQENYESQKYAAVNILRLVTQNIQGQYNQLVGYEMEFISRRRDLLKQENATALAYFEALRGVAGQARLDEDAAREQALGWLAERDAAKAGPIVFDHDLTVLAHADPAQIGRRAVGFTTIRGEDAFANVLGRLANADENYAVLYGPAGPGQPPRKVLAYFSLFRPWGWVVASLEPIGDLEELAAAKREAIVDELTRTFSDISASGPGYLMLFTGSGEMLAHPTVQRGTSLSRLSGGNPDPLYERMKAAAATPGVPLVYEWAMPGGPDDRQTKVAFVEYFRPLDWYVAYTLPERDINNVAAGLIRELMTLILVMAALGLILLLVFLRRFTRPILELMGLVNELPRREFLLDPDGLAALTDMARRRSDEPGRLAAALLGLQNKLRRHLAELDRLGQERIRHIAALQNVNVELEAKVGQRTANLVEANERLKREILEREAAAESLRASEEKFRALAESMPGIIYLSRNDERFTKIFLNDMVERVTGYPKEDFLRDAVNFVDLIHPEDQPRITEAASEAISRKAPFRLEYRLRRKDGQWRWMEDHGVGVDAPDGRVAYIEGVINDVTERVEAREGLRAAKEQAEAANVAKSEFLATMSHEIRTPLNTVLGMAELLGATGLSEPQRHYVSSLTSSGQLLLKLLNDILEFSRIESGRVDIEDGVFHVPSLLADVAAIVGPAAEAKNLAFELDIPPGLAPWRRGDEGRIRQVLVNLAANAVKFTHRGFARISLEEPADIPGRLLFRVADTGEGIAPDRQAAIFDKFTQADSSIRRRHGGTGLGLSISLALTRAMGGQLSVTSEPGRGATFVLSLPLPAAEAPAPAEVEVEAAWPDDAPFSPASPCRVLVAEDVPANLEIIRLYLSEAPVVLTFAANGREAVAAFRAGEFDVALMDIEMPEVDGLEATRAIRDIERETGRAPVRVHAVTAHAFDEFRTKCVQAGCDGYLTKPLTKRALFAALCSRQAAMPRTAPGAAPPGDGPKCGDAPVKALVKARLEPLMPIFFDSVDRFLDDASAGLAKGDWPVLVRVGHAVKGTAGTYGVTCLASLAADFEAAARRRDQEAALSALTRLKAARDAITIEYDRS